MTRYHPGDYIPLAWEDFAETLYVYGHVTPDEFAATCAAENPGPGVVPVPGEPLHLWGAFRFNGQDECGNPSRILRTYRERGRGMFPVTAADVARWDVSADTRNPAVWGDAELAEWALKDAAKAAFRNRWINGLPPSPPGAVVEVDRG